MEKAHDFLTVDEAARQAGVSHWTIRKWLDETPHKLTRYKAQSRVMVSRLELLELVKPKKVEDHTK